jgi:tripeptide aminopeptidase
MINKDRIAETFRFLVETDSISREEGRICLKIQKILESMGGETILDHAGLAIGSDTDNLIARFKGITPGPPLLLNAHMDTVEPGRGIRPILKDGVFRSDGTTILGADCKSAIAIILEVLRVLQEDNFPHGPLEIVFTVCEEIGLLGAKHLDFSLLNSKYGFALDASDTNGIVTRAPSANHFEFRVYGQDAHAGAAPEKGINAIHLASKAISELKLGRIDSETTCNIGYIRGGRATNIVPDLVTVKGEVRSHNEEQLNLKTQEIKAVFQKTVDEEKSGRDQHDGFPRLECSVSLDFPRTNIPETHKIVTLARQAAQNLGRTMKTKMTGGGSDASIFSAKGIITGVLGTGMRDMHTLRESILLDDMVESARLLLEIIRLQSKEPIPVGNEQP